MKVCNRCGDLHEGTGATCASCYRPRRRHYTREQRDTHKLYCTAAWRKVRAEALDRDGHLCQHCNAAHDLVVHHLVEVSTGIDPLDLDNLQTLCRRCHGRTHAVRRAHAESSAGGDEK